MKCYCLHSCRSQHREIGRQPPVLSAFDCPPPPPKKKPSFLLWVDLGLFCLQKPIQYGNRTKDLLVCIKVHSPLHHYGINIDKPKLNLTNSESWDGRGLVRTAHTQLTDIMFDSYTYQCVRDTELHQVNVAHKSLGQQVRCSGSRQG